MTTKIKSGVIAAGAVDANALSDNSITIAHLNCSDGTNGQVLSTDGSGTLSFTDMAGGVDGIVSSADATAITIDSSENVGIGITNPSTRTHIYSSVSSTPLVVESTANTYVGIKNTTQTAYIGAVTSNMIFENNGAERMRIDGSGKAIFKGVTENELYTQFLSAGAGSTVSGYVGRASSVVSGGTATDFGVGGGAGNLVFATGGYTERMRIGSTGNVFLQTGGAALQWQNGYQTITGDAASNDLIYRTYANHIWKTTTGASSTTDGTERMRINSNGEGLYVYNNGGGNPVDYGTGAEIRLDGLSQGINATHYLALSGYLPGYNPGQYNCLKTNLGDLHFAAGGVYTGYIGANTGFTDISDEREKENIVTISNATAKLKQLRGVYHTWKDTENRGTDTHIGLIAQEVEAVVPEVVSTSNPTSLNTPESDTVGLKGVAYAKLVPLLIETIKELEARITILEE